MNITQHWGMPSLLRVATKYKPKFRPTPTARLQATRLVILALWQSAQILFGLSDLFRPKGRARDNLVDLWLSAHFAESPKALKNNAFKFGTDIERSV